jgi:hypothetical protein
MKSRCIAMHPYTVGQGRPHCESPLRFTAMPTGLPDPGRLVGMCFASLTTFPFASPSPQQGAQIQGTFWRAAASRYDAQLQEGRVYVFHRFKARSNKLACMHACMHACMQASRKERQAFARCQACVKGAGVIRATAPIGACVRGQPPPRVWGVVAVFARHGTARHERHGRGLGSQPRGAPRAAAGIGQMPAPTWPTGQRAAPELARSAWFGCVRSGLPLAIPL